LKLLVSEGIAIILAGKRIAEPAGFRRTQLLATRGGPEARRNRRLVLFTTDLLDKNRLGGLVSHACSLYVLIMSNLTRPRRPPH
jgi:hypothetical protein